MTEANDGKKRRKLDIAEVLRGGGANTIRHQLRLTLQLSMPSIVAQLSTILMQYIDASMVGSLGASASASIGIVSTTTWLFWGVGSAIVAGFSVQAAHLIGADRDDSARRLVGQAMTGILTVAAVLALLGLAISGSLPRWLGGAEDVVPQATSYFRVFSLSLPVLFVNFLAGSLLRCSGNTLVPGLLNVAMCVLDILFNWLLIFPARDIVVSGMTLHIPGADLGVTGAALGTVLAELVIMGLMLWYLLRKSRHLNLKKGFICFRPSAEVLRKALRISLPMGTEHIIMCSAQIFITVIVAPLGTAAIAADAFNSREPVLHARIRNSGCRNHSCRADNRCGTSESDAPFCLYISWHGCLLHDSHRIADVYRCAFIDGDIHAGSGSA